MKSLLLSVLLLLNPLSGMAATASAQFTETRLPEGLKGDMPVDWQKVVLDELIQTRLIRALSQNLSEQYFAVTVSTTLKAQSPTPAESFPAKEGTDSAERPPLSKLNLDLSLLVAAQKQKTSATAIFSLIDRVDVSVILDERVPSEKADVVRTLVTGTVGSITPKSVQVKISSGPLYTPPERLEAEDRTAIKLQDARDAAQVAKILAEAQKAEQKTENDTENSKPQAGAAQPVPPKPWTAHDWITELKYPVGLVLIAFFGGIFALLISRGRNRIEDRRVAILESQNKRQEETEQRVADATASAANPIHVTTGTSGTGAVPSVQEERVRKTIESFEQGVARFRQVLSQSPDRAAQMIRQWIRNPRHGASEALALLPQALQLEELNQLFNRLGLEERKEWRQFLMLPNDAGSVATAEAFIASQVVDTFLAPSPKIDEKIRNEINELNLRDCIDLMKEDPESGAVLANILGSAQVARIFSLLPAEITSQITSASIRIPDSQLAVLASRLMTRITALKAKKKDVQFLDNAAELLRDVGPERESAIFGALVEAGEFRLLEGTARQFFPAELIVKLPPQVLRQALDSFSLEKRAEIILSRQPEEREPLLSVYGGEGSRLREMIELEIERLQGDELKLKRIARNRNSLWKELADSCRALIRKDETAREFADIALGEWLSERSNGAVGASGSSHAA